jgi:hypothetical protein
MLKASVAKGHNGSGDVQVSYWFGQKVGAVPIACDVGDFDKALSNQILDEMQTEIHVFIPETVLTCEPGSLM